MGHYASELNDRAGSLTIDTSEAATRKAAQEAWKPKPFEERAMTSEVHKIVTAIEQGSHDKELTTLSEAVRLRKQKIRSDLLDQVREVYGPNAEITQKRPDFAQTGGSGTLGSRQAN